MVQEGLIKHIILCYIVCMTIWWGEFESYSTANYMCDQITIMFY